MDIVANSLSAGKLRTGDVTVRGKNIIDWFESKLSASVSFVGVFKDLDDAPKKNGAVAIVGSKDYIYSEDAGKWQEFGDEGQIGAISQAVQTLSDSLSDYVMTDDLSSFAPSAVSQLVNDAGYISAETTLSGYGITDAFINDGRITLGDKSIDTSAFLTGESDPVFREMSSSFLTGESDPVFREMSSSFLTGESDPVFSSVSSTFITNNILRNATGISVWNDPFPANDNVTDPTGPAIWFYPRAFGAPDGAYINAITIHTTATKQSDIPGTSVYARIYPEGEEANPLADSWPVNVVSVDTLYTFNLKKEVPLDSNRKYGVRFYRSNNSNVAVIGYHLYAYHKAEGGPYPNPGTDIAYGAWNDTAGKNLLRPALSVSWTAGIQHQIPADLSDFTNSPGYLVSNDISDYYQKSETSSAMQIALVIDSIRNMISSAMTSTYEYTQEEIEGDSNI